MATARSDATASESQVGTVGRCLTLLYGATVYVYFLGLFLYLIGFIGNFAVPKTIDSGTPGVGAGAALLNILPLGLFAVQHTVMARPAFKRWWIQIIPKATERTTFVALTVAILTLFIWIWQPLPKVIWHVEGWAGTALLAISLIGWGIAYILLALIVEERTLVELHGDAYEDYRRRVPKLFPWLPPRERQHGN